MKSHVGTLVQTDVITYTADGAIPVNGVETAILYATSASTVMTLADGEVGQNITVICLDATNTVTLTPANFVDGTNITFTANDSVVLKFITGGWKVVSNEGGVIA